jgi:hypothetical protein
MAILCLPTSSNTVACHSIIPVMHQQRRLGYKHATTLRQELRAIEAHILSMPAKSTSTSLASTPLTLLQHETA